MINVKIPTDKGSVMACSHCTGTRNGTGTGRGNWTSTIGNNQSSLLSLSWTSVNVSVQHIRCNPKCTVSTISSNCTRLTSETWSTALAAVSVSYRKLVCQHLLKFPKQFSKCIWADVILENERRTSLKSQSLKGCLHITKFSSRNSFLQWGYSFGIWRGDISLN